MHAVITTASKQAKQRLHTLTIDTHLCMAILILYTVHLTTDFSAVVEVSEASRLIDVLYCVLGLIVYIVVL